MMKNLFSMLGGSLLGTGLVVEGYLGALFATLAAVVTVGSNIALSIWAPDA